MYSASIASASTLPQLTQSSGPLPRNTGRPGSSWTAVPPSFGTSPGRTSRITIRATARLELPELAREVLHERVEHAAHHALAHRRRLAGDLGVRVDVPA